MPQIKLRVKYSLWFYPLPSFSDWLTQFNETKIIIFLGVFSRTVEKKFNINFSIFPLPFCLR